MTGLTDMLPVLAWLSLVRLLLSRASLHFTRWFQYSSLRVKENSASCEISDKVDFFATNHLPQMEPHRMLLVTILVTVHSNSRFWAWERGEFTGLAVFTE